MSSEGEAAVVRWEEAGEKREARWRSESGAPPPGRIAIAGDNTKAAVAFRQACEGMSHLFRGDYRNARQLLAAMGRRLEEHPPEPSGDLKADFLAHRQHQSTVHQVLSRLLVAVDGEYRVELKHAQRVKEACVEVWGPPDGSECVVSVRELLGMIGAHEWRTKGLEVAALGGERIHPHYGVFAPIRSEYVDLIAEAPLPKASRAFDLGTGTGVLAILIARRGVPEIVAIDCDPRAIACARENVAHFKLTERVRVEQADLFPEGRADLVVFNPPWLPARPRTPVEKAIYDPESGLLLRFLEELPAHLSPGGEGWLVISNLGELLGLRATGLIEEAAAAAGLELIARHCANARHPRAQDRSDLLHPARSKEVTTLYRFRARAGTA